MIIIDNVYENFHLQSENGILIRSWFEDPNDVALYELGPLLRDIASKKVKDVRVALKDIRDKMLIS
jgi:TFIIF-interacting CTD phosphatase-like protein